MKKNKYKKPMKKDTALTLIFMILFLLYCILGAAVIALFFWLRGDLHVAR